MSGLGARTSTNLVRPLDTEGFPEARRPSAGERSEAGHGLRWWFKKGFWAVSDQGLFAVSNFMLNVLLARWLTAQDYGAFTVAFSAFILVGVLHTAVLTEPMLVFGPSKYEGQFSKYLGVLLYGHFVFAVLSSVVLLLVSLGFELWGSDTISAALLAFALAGPLVFLLWLMRRACYVPSKPHLAALGGALYMGLMMAGAYALYRLEWLSAPSALGVMGLSSLLISLWLIKFLRVRPHLRGNELGREALTDHWTYGRWAVATSVLTWVPAEVYYLLLPIWGGLEDTASLKALMNFIMPMIMAFTALGILLVPTLARARGSAKFDTLVRFALVFFVLGSALYWVLLGTLHQQLVAWLYGGRYAEYSDLLWLLGLLPVIAGVTYAAAGALRALERPDLVFRTYAFSTAATLTLGVGFVFLWGVLGAIAGFLVSYGTTAAVAVFFYWRLRDSTPVRRRGDELDVRQNF